LVELRARAFAACFLAPELAVQNLLQDRDPTSEESIGLVGEHFQIGRIAACYRLKHVYRLAQKTHLSMVARSRAPWPGPADHPDRIEVADIGLRSGVFQRAVLAALVEGRLDRLRAREYLRLPHTDWLPEYPSLTDDQRAPLRSVETDVRGVAQAHLERALPDERLAAAEVTGGGRNGWVVKVLRLPSYEPEGELWISYDREPGRFVRAS
jgi:hypothetical protein